MTVIVSQATLTDAIAGIVDSTPDAVTAVVTAEGHDRVRKKDTRLRTMMQEFVTKTLKMKTRPCLVRKKRPPQN